MTRPLVSFAACYACWFACVGGAARGLPWAGPLAVAAYVAAYLRTIPSGAARSRQAWLLAQAGLAGYAADSILVLAGVLRSPPHAVPGPAHAVALASIAALWACAMPLLVWMEARARRGVAEGARTERFAA